MEVSQSFEDNIKPVEGALRTQNEAENNANNILQSKPVANLKNDENGAELQKEDKHQDISDNESDKENYFKPILTKQVEQTDDNNQISTIDTKKQTNLQNNLIAKSNLKESLEKVGSHETIKYFESSIASKEENQLIQETEIGSTEVEKSILPVKSILEDEENEEIASISHQSDIKRKKKFRPIIESDEEEEDSPDLQIKNITNEYVSETENGNEGNIKTKKKMKRLAIVDSENEDETSDVAKLAKANAKKLINSLPYFNEENEDEEEHNENKKVRKRLTIIDSDEESEPENEEHNFERLDESKKKTVDSTVYKTNSKGELVPETYDFATQKSRLSALCDSESSEDEREMNKIVDEEEIRPVVYKNKKKKKDVVKKMSGKEAMEQRKEIESESQRMLRERQVSLPYHRPKQRSLQEFLQKRPRFVTAISNKSSNASLAIKMTSKQINIISKNLEKREKEVQEFFKSDSETDDEIEDDHTEDVKNDENIDESNVPDNEMDERESSIKENNIDSAIMTEANFEEKTLPEENSETKNVESTTNPEEMESTIMETEPSNENSSVTEINSEIQNKETDLEENINSHSNKSDIPNSENIKDKMECDVDSETEKIKLNNETIKMVTEEPTNEKNEEENKSMEYEFNLDGIEEEEETSATHDVNIEEANAEVSKDNTDENVNENLVETFDIAIEKDHLVKVDQLMKKFNEEYQEIEKRNAEEEIKKKKLSRLELIKQKLGDIQPKLSGDPDLVIDLDEGVTKQNEVNQLINRFMQHTSKKNISHKHKVQLSILNVTGDGEVHKENVTIKVDDSEGQPEIVEKPGEQLKKLREELQKQMALKRAELWQQKQKMQAEDNEESVYEGEKSECGADEEKDILNIDEEEELTDPELSDEEDQNDEEDEIEKLINNEAEEDDEIDGEDNDEENFENDEEEVQNEKEEEEHVELPPADEKSSKKTLKRIIQISDDSDEEDNDETLTNPDGDSTDSWDEDCPPPAQPGSARTPVRKFPEPKTEFGFLTPVCHLTGLQSMNSGFMKDSPNSPSFAMPAEPSPLKATGWQKKLFSDDFSNSQSTLEDAAMLCSGKFPSPTPKENEVDTLQVVVNENESSQPTTQEILDICSGKFTGITQEISKPKVNIIENIVIKQNNTLKNLVDDQEDKFISQLLGEQEMEEFKKKFVSPITNTKQNDTTPNSAIAINIKFDSSDDDDEEDVIGIRKKMKKKTVIVDSDDEEDGVAVDQNEEIDLHDNDGDDEEENMLLDGDDNKSDDEEQNGAEEEVKEYEYDSEENEIEVSKPKKNILFTKLKASELYEDEAELSESDWGSADEDERNIDYLEAELGDQEKFDENKVKQDLERIHMRRILDDDNREVKILQEMLLEDGELHGEGRQRQFRWKNIDNLDVDNENVPPQDDDVLLLDDDETEEEWRKKRFERDSFLRKQMESSQEEEDDFNITMNTQSEVFKLGQKAIIKNANNTTIISEKTVNVSTNISSFLLSNKRGSFLTRSDQVLSRLAEYNKTSNGSTSGNVKNSRNFVFQTVNPGIVESVDKKRKAVADGTPVDLKKLRLNNFSPASRKSTDKNSSKRLFSNW